MLAENAAREDISLIADARLRDAHAASMRQAGRLSAPARRYWRSRVAENVSSGKFSFMRFSSQLLRTR